MSDELRDRIAEALRRETDNGGSRTEDYAQAVIEELEAEFDRFIARIKAEAVAEALRELLDDATSVKDECGHVEGYVPEWAVWDEIDRIEKEER